MKNLWLFFALLALCLSIGFALDSHERLGRTIKKTENRIEHLKGDGEELVQKLASLESRVRALQAVEADTVPDRPSLSLEITSYEPTGNSTATGIKPRHGSVAVDPSVIPIGTLIRFVGFKPAPEWCMADDTGGKVKGPVLDVYLESGIIHRTKAVGVWVKHERLNVQYLLVEKP